MKKIVIIFMLSLAATALQAYPTLPACQDHNQQGVFHEVQNTDIWFPDDNVFSDHPEAAKPVAKEGTAVFIIKTDTFITPPVIRTKTTCTRMTVNAGKSATVEHSSGTTIQIPPNAFTDAEGNIVNGEVNIEYREYMNPVEIFFSHIPMTYDSAGAAYNFESAGMMEFRATKDGKQIFANPESKITVNLASNNADPRMNLYYFDESSNKWAYKGKDKISGAKQISTADKTDRYDFSYDFDVELAAVDPITNNFKVYHKRNLIKWNKKSSPRNFRFKIRQNTYKRSFKREQLCKGYPESKAIKNTWWMYDGDNKRKDYRRLQRFCRMSRYNRSYKADLSEDSVIYDLRMIPNPNGDNYLMTFLFDGKKYAFPVIPDFYTQNPEIIQKRNEKMYARYAVALKERLEEWEATDMIYNRNMNVVNRGLNSQTQITRNFRMDNFGIWNVDALRKMNRPKQIAAKFVDEDSIEYKAKFTCLLDFTRTGTLTFKGNKIVFDRNSDNSLLVYLDNGKIGVVNTEDFRKTVEGSRQTFLIDIISKDEATPQQVKNLLAFN